MNYKIYILIFITTAFSVSAMEHEVNQRYSVAPTISSVPQSLARLGLIDQRIALLEQLETPTANIFEELLDLWFERAQILRRAQIIERKDIEPVITYADLLLRGYLTDPTISATPTQQYRAKQKKDAAEGSLRSLESRDQGSSSSVRSSQLLTPPAPANPRFSLAATTLSQKPFILNKLTFYENRISELEQEAPSTRISLELLDCWFEKVKILREANMVTAEKLQKIITYADQVLADTSLSQLQRDRTNTQRKQAQGSLATLLAKKPETVRLTGSQEAVQSNQQPSSLDALFSESTPTEVQDAVRRLQLKQRAEVEARKSMVSPSEQSPQVGSSNALEIPTLQDRINAAIIKARKPKDLLNIAQLYYEKFLLTQDLKDREQVRKRVSEIEKIKGLDLHDQQLLRILLRSTTSLESGASSSRS